MATPAVGSGAQLTENVMTAALAKTLSKVQRKALETAMLKEVFMLINSDPDDHRECFEVALAKLETSNALEAETFSTWEGYRAFESKVKAFEEKRALFPDYTHMLPATDMLVISAVRELRRVKCDGKDCVSVELDKFGLWDWLPLALEVYELTDKPFMISKIGHTEQQRHESGPDGFVFYRPVPCPGILAVSSAMIQWDDFEIPSTPVSTSKQESTVSREEIMEVGRKVFDKLMKNEFDQSVDKATDTILKAVHKVRTYAREQQHPVEQQATADMPGVPKDEN